MDGILDEESLNKTLEYIARNIDNNGQCIDNNPVYIREMQVNLLSFFYVTSNDMSVHIMYSDTILAIFA